MPEGLKVQIPGRAFRVTRGNSGIGTATATEIAKQGERPAVRPVQASLGPLHAGGSAQCPRQGREGPASTAGVDRPVVISC